jgi:hypothetical protein
MVSCILNLGTGLVAVNVELHGPVPLSVPKVAPLLVGWASELIWTLYNLGNKNRLICSSGRSVLECEWDILTVFKRWQYSVCHAYYFLSVNVTVLSFSSTSYLLGV